MLLTATSLRVARGNPPISLESSVRAVEVLNSIGVVVSSAEWIVARGITAPGSLHDWDVTRSRVPFFGGRLGAALRPLFGGPGFVLINSIRGAAAVVAIAPTSRRVRLLASSIACGTGYLMTLRGFYGNDGAEQMSLLTGVTVVLTRATTDQRIQQDALRFLAAQSALSYGAAGLAKAVSPVWRSGDAVKQILRTRVYGNRHVYKALTRHPHIAAALSRITIVFELTFPWALVLPATPRRLLLLTGFGFHAANAGIMGLNRFFWSFVATYPAVEYCAADILSRRAERPH